MLMPDNTQPICSFEVLATPIAPGIPDVPYVQQGFFLQVTNLGPDATVNIPFFSTPLFSTGQGAVTLFTNIIDASGTPSQYPVRQFLDFPTAGPPLAGFSNIPMMSGVTYLFGVQYLLLPGAAQTAASKAGSTPQDKLEARGFAGVFASPGSSLLILPTIRQVFNNYDANGNLLDVSEAAYTVPLATGPLVTF